MLDWGVAHVASEDDPFRGLIAGTLTYVAPEQIRGDALTSAADIYSLAVVAYHLLCRRPPFAAKTDLELLNLPLRAEPPRPNIAGPSIPHELDELLVAMLAKDPAARPSLDDVERVLRARLAQVAPVSAPETRRRLARGSHPGISMAALAEAVAEQDSAMDQAARMPVDVLGRPALLPSPPFSPVWAALAIALVALIGLVSALP